MAMIETTKLVEQYGLCPECVQEYTDLFAEHSIPVGGGDRGDTARRLVMVSTHGYWGDPPPAGVPDTGGQTYYVLEVSKAWARQGRRVIILARWFEPYPRVERFADGVWLVRIRAGDDAFIRKEAIYGLTPELGEAATAVGALFGAQGVVGHYADGMVVAAEMGERLAIPVACVPHSMGVLKMLRLGWNPLDQAQLRDPEYHFWTRETFELAALRSANFEIANTPREPEILERHYGLEFPHAVMPAGAASTFFDAGATSPDPAVPQQFGLHPRRYVLFWGRLSEAKNVDGVVRVLGEARRRAPDLCGTIRVAIVGGSPDSPSGEEREVEEAIRKAMAEYGLGTGDVLRIESQTHAVLAPLARGALAYVGMQRLEPFGMGAAEAMGAGLPVLISRNAGITRWLEDGEHAVFVDPDDPQDAAGALIRLLRDRGEWEALGARGREKSLIDFSWEGIARRQGMVMDRLHSGLDPRERGPRGRPQESFTRRTGRAYHRATPAWRGDAPKIKPHHVAAAHELLPRIASRVRAERGERLVVALGGESGSGKTEIAHLLALMLRPQGLSGRVISGDAFFVLPPAQNHANRVDADARGCLAEAIGPHEVDLERLDRIVAAVRDRDVATVCVPSDCRSLPGRRYPEVPIALHGVDVLFVDLTYSLLLDNVACKVFLERSSLDNIEHVRQRNLERDPDQDFDFIQRVLTLEHEIIDSLKQRADIVVDRDYRVVAG